MTDSVLFQAFVYLVAAVVCVPIAKRGGLGSVLGYLVAGVLIGPYVLGLVGGEGHRVMHFAEFGVVMMLFLVGLELKPQLLWQLRRPILGLGGAQVVVTSAACMGGAMALGLAWKPALAVGLTLAMSSTAIVLQSLNEKGLLKSTGGQSSFSVLLFQDIAVIPILAVFPLLGHVTEKSGGGRPAWLQALILPGAVAVLVLAGRFVVRPMFRWLAATRLREVFTEAALLLVIGIALLMQRVGLSPALGTFVAGVVLAESEYRHELESDIEPFKGLLLGLFFVSVGAQIDFAYVAAQPLQVAGLVAGVITLKLIILYGLARVFGLDRPARWLLAFGLAQVGEFAFVLLSFGLKGQVFGAEVAAPMVAVVALSMALTPLLFLALERLILPRLAARAPTRAHDTIAHADAPVVMAGFGRFGQVVGRLLRANGISVTVLDLDVEIVDFLRRLGHKVHYGDASRLELLHAAGCERARLFILAIDDVDQSVAVAAMVRKHFPHLDILARARDRPHYYKLHKLGVKVVLRETFASALELGTEALRSLGFRGHTAHRMARLWRQQDERALLELSKLWGGDQTIYFDAAKKAVAEAERLMKAEDPKRYRDLDDGWDNEELRKDKRTTGTGEADAAAAVTPTPPDEPPPAPPV